MFTEFFNNHGGVVKRNGDIVSFDSEKIKGAIVKAILACNGDPKKENDNIDSLVSAIEADCKAWIEENPTVNGLHVEKVQDIVEQNLIARGYVNIAKEYILYRQKRTEIRKSKGSIFDAISHIINPNNQDDAKRDNGNIDGNTAMGTMLQIGASVSKDFYLNNMISKDVAQAYREGYIHIHDLDFYALTVTCCQIDALKLFKGGFNTGHGFLREPNSIGSYGTHAAIAIQSDQNDCHGGQSIPNFDYSMAPGVYKSYRKAIKGLYDVFKETVATDEKYGGFIKCIDSDSYVEDLLSYGRTLSEKEDTSDETLDEKLIRLSYEKVKKETYQAMEGFVHNLNTLHSRAGGQVPFSSINLGTDTSEAGRMATENLLLAMEAGLGHGETAIFPIVVFKVKEGINYNPEDPNYDLFKLACRVTSKRLFPNFVFIDAPHNIQYYKPGHPETEVATMGCRTRVIGNVYDTEREISHSRGNLSFTTINLPMLAIEANGDEDKFYASLLHYLDLCKKQLLERFEIQARRKVRNMPFLMGQHIWLDSEKLGPDDEVREVIKHGSLSIGFVGLAEAMVALYGHHHGEGEEYHRKALNIIRFMREYTDKAAEETKLNFSVLATPAESYAGRALRKTKEKYGVIVGVTDKDYFTNSNHIPVYFPISAYDKIRLEAPFHELTNAGHITYVELDGDVSKNVDVIEKIVRCMKESGIGYGSINHPVDRDPVCGYTGIINDECPNCHRHEEEGEHFERIRRITGYLVGTLDRWNNAKRAEERDRVKHGTSLE